MYLIYKGNEKITGMFSAAPNGRQDSRTWIKYTHNNSFYYVDYTSQAQALIYWRAVPKPLNRRL